LAEIDPESAAQIDANNIARIIRALELFALTGEKPSLLRSSHSFARLRYQAIVFGISPPRDVLYRRIDCRTQEMFNMGIEKEVCERMAQGRLTPMSCRALGFSEALAVARGEWTREKAVEETAKRTRHYAKRQLTWFRADPMVEWLDWPPSIEKVVAKLVMLGFGNSNHHGM
jgi:tRNA dimethylallyltransferase